eukprot:scaffold70749_cov62-Phaeocystis_antarctica.AAC.5
MEGSAPQRFGKDMFVSGQMYPGRQAIRRPGCKRASRNFGGIRVHDRGACVAGPTGRVVRQEVPNIQFPVQQLVAGRGENRKELVIWSLRCVMAELGQPFARVQLPLAVHLDHNEMLRVR